MEGGVEWQDECCPSGLGYLYLCLGGLCLGEGYVGVAWGGVDFGVAVGAYGLECFGVGESP